MSVALPAGARATVRVPATSANLGPGYDCAGLALDLYDELEAEIRSDSSLVIEVTGEGADSVPTDDSHLVVRALARGFAEAGLHVDGLTLRCHNRLPHGRGLGSSSAAIVGGLGLARALLPDGGALLDDAKLLALATELEGHPDNVAPAILGGFTLAWTDEFGLGRAIRLKPYAGLEPVIAIPRTPLATERARELLPATVSHRDAAANSARSALLVAAVTTRPDLLLTATEDKLHQDYRRFAYPQAHALMSGLRQQGIPAMISGAGPTVIAFGVAGTARDGMAVLAEIQRQVLAAGADWQREFSVQAVALAPHGVH